MNPVVIEKVARAELVLGPGPQGLTVAAHWLHVGGPKGFKTEQAARDWIDTNSSDWIANHPRNSSARNGLLPV